MLRCKSLLRPFAYSGVACPARVRVSVSGDPSLSVPNSGAAYPPEGTKEKQGSGMHGRWALVRALRSGRMVGRCSDGDKKRSEIFGSSAPLTIASRSSVPLAVADEGKDGGETKKIFLLTSDHRRRWTAEYAVNAARRQFGQCYRFCRTNTYMFSGIDDTERLTEIIKEAAKEEALLLYTLEDPAMAEAAKNTCRLLGVPSANVLKPIINSGLANAPGTVLGGSSHGLGEGHGDGGAAAGLRKYIVDVEEPNIVFASPDEKDAWYRSFISVDESRWVCSFHLSYGFAVWLTEEELATLEKTEGFVFAYPAGVQYLE